MQTAPAHREDFWNAGPILSIFFIDIPWLALVINNNSSTDPWCELLGLVGTYQVVIKLVLP